MPQSETKEEYIRSLKRVYDDFPNKDMSWEQFRDEMLDMTDPDKIANDLAAIKIRKARLRANRIRIERLLSN